MSDAAWLMGYFGSLAEDGDAEADGDGTISRNGHMAGANPNDAGARLVVSPNVLAPEST